MNLLTSVLASALVLLAPQALSEDADIVFKFHVNKTATDGVTDTNSLVEFLRRDVHISTGISVDSTLWLDMRGYAGDPSFRSPEVFQTPELRIALNESQSVSEISWADAVIESHGNRVPDDGDIWDEQQVENWTESNAWGRLLWMIEASLPDYTDSFGPPNSQFQELRVTGVEVRTFEFSEQDANPGAEFAQFGFVGDEIEGPVILVKPDLIWDDVTFSLRDDLSVAVDVLLIHIEPTSPKPKSENDAAQAAARGIASEVCALLAPVGSSEITIGEQTLSGNAVSVTGPRGEFLVVMGQQGDPDDSWCLMVGSGAPVETDRVYDLVSPEVFMADPTSLTSVFERSGGTQELFWVTDGQATIAVEKGEFSMSGMMVQNQAVASSAKLTGSFKAERMD